jgi:hypothetical protein
LFDIICVGAFVPYRKVGIGAGLEKGRDFGLRDGLTGIAL